MSCELVVWMAARWKLGREGDSTSTTSATSSSLLLQDIDCIWYKHSWRVLCAEKACWRVPSPTGWTLFLYLVWLLDYEVVSDCFSDQDMGKQPPTQELVAKDLHAVEWRFRHIFRGKSHGMHVVILNIWMLNCSPFMLIPHHTFWAFTLVIGLFSEIRWLCSLFYQWGELENMLSLENSSQRCLRVLSVLLGFGSWQFWVLLLPRVR